MQLFFTIVAGIVVGFLLVVALIYVFVRLWLKRTIKQFAHLASEATKGISQFMQPLRITLQRERDPGWNDKAAVDRLVRPLIAAGFQDAGVYTIEEFPVIAFQALAQPDKSVYAAVYEHPDNGVWLDVVSRYEDGTALTSTTAKGAGIDHRRTSQPNDSTPIPIPPPLQAAPGPPAGQRVRGILRAISRGLRTALRRRNGLALRARRTTEEESATCRSFGKTDRPAGQASPRDAASPDGPMASGQASGKLSRSEQPLRREVAQMEYRMIFVHDRMTADEAYGMFMNFLDWEDEDAAEECSERAERLAHGPAREAFRRMIQTLPAGRAVKKVGHVTEPVASDVYLGPDSMDGEVE
jgi:hypothetical protein